MYEMTKEEARQYMTEHATEILTPDKSKKGFICPKCHSGQGKKGTGITSKDGNRHFSCWSDGCFTNADIIDIIGTVEGKTTYIDKLRAAADAFGITITDLDNTYTAPRTGAKESAAKKKEPEQPKAQTPAESAEDMTTFFLEAAKHITETDYHRGISLETLKRFMVGYVAEWKSKKAPSAVKRTPRLIIPTSKYSYLARDTRDSIPDREYDYRKQKEGPVHIFNRKALDKEIKYIFVTEGEIDALSIIDAGGEAVATGSAAYTKMFLEHVKNQKQEHEFIICMDNDERGESARDKIVAGFDELGKKYYIVNISGESNDCNEAYVKNPEKFKKNVAKAIEDPEALIKELATDAYKRESAAYELPDFLERIKASAKDSFFSTGFPSLDHMLDGGLYAGLYFVGAISSLGKTTFILQMADNIARNGNDVLIFSLEMAKEELIAKSVSRMTLHMDLAEFGSVKYAKTTRGILTGSRYSKYSEEEQMRICDSVIAYGNFAQNIYITQGVGDVTIDVIRNKIERHIKITGKKPVVIIDYLQIIAPTDMRASDKQNVDKAVLELKRISRDHGIPIIGISSFNRENYDSPVNLAAFKESGAVEYSSDVLIGLQYDGMDYRDKEKEQDRKKRIRELLDEMADRAKNGKAQDIQVKILKNRNGSKGTLSMKFYPMFNYFHETTPFKAIDANSKEGKDCPF